MPAPGRAAFLPAQSAARHVPATNPSDDFRRAAAASACRVSVAGRKLHHRALAGAGVALCIGLAGWLLMRVGERTLQDGAEQVALGHAQFMRDTTPELERLLDGGELAPSTREQLLRLRRLGEVFRFKIFDRQGRLLLVSDQLDQADPLAASRASLHGGPYDAPNGTLGAKSVVKLHSGSAEASQPATYVEAYIPLLQDARVIGVIEIDLDQSARRAGMVRALAQVGLILAGLLALLGGAFALYSARQSAERQRSAERLRYLSEHDSLCGALNRGSFHDALQRAADIATTDAPGFAVLCVDLDHFKDINDAHGLAVGDAVLREAAARLRALLRPGDLLARLGADEFALMQNTAADSDNVARLAGRIVQALAEPYVVHGLLLVCSASVGATRSSDAPRSATELLHQADVAMVRAKQAGRGRFAFYDADLDRRLEARRQLAHDLRNALATDALSLHYQPQFAGDGQTLLGYEALMRWRHPTRGMVPPMTFIALAEETGQIEALGTWALERACAEAAGWPGALSVSVNLSAAQFHGTTDLVALVDRTLAASGLGHERLVLEITESLLMSDTDAVVRTLDALAQMKVQIAMDDFGTGYSSLGSLWRFPFGKVKIDRAFTRGLENDDRVALIVRSIVSLAHSLGMHVNAEGVETVAQAALLRHLGCDELQGFLLGRPAPADALHHTGAARAQPTRPAAPDWSDLQTVPAAL